MTKIHHNEHLIDGPDGKLQLIHTIVSSINQQSTENDCAIICHPHPVYGGTMNNKVVHMINKTFNNAGVSTVRFNFRGVEKSEGEFANAIGEQQDLITVIRWLAQQVTQTSTLYLAGFSFGSYIAAQLAAEHQESLPLNIKKLLLVAPPVNMYDFAALDIRIPCLVIQGGQDTVVVPEQVKQWFDTLSDNVQLEWNDQAEHFFHGQLNFIRDTLNNHWFASG